MIPDESGAASDERYDHDLVVVGGGVSGPAAGVFAARAGLDTVVLDRGRSSIRRCAFLENYLGFPDGIDVDTFCELTRAHAEAAGCTYVEELATGVHRADGGGFRVRTAEGRDRRAPRVVVAAAYEGECLEPLDDGEMFATTIEGGEERRIFDRTYADADGRTPVEGLYVAGPLAGCVNQAITSAGHGARVGCSVVRDALRERGYWDELAERYWDWRLKAETRTDDWDAHAEALVERTVPDEGVSDERVERAKAEVREHWASQYVPREAVERRRERGQRALLERLDDEAVRAYAVDRLGLVDPDEDAA